MSSPHDFISRWGDENPLLRFPADAVQGVTLAEGDEEFLTRVGLPTSAAPFLDFERPDAGGWTTVARAWRLPVEPFGRYRVIGTNGRGDPLAVDEDGEGEVVYLVHDDHFGRVFVNHSVRQLAESLLAYHRLVVATNSANGVEAFHEGRVPEELRHRLERELEAIDPGATDDGTFWHGELLELEANAAA